MAKVLKDHYIISFFVFLLLLFMVFHAQTSMAATLSGLSLFTAKVLPALFPFFFLSKLLTDLGGLRPLSRVFEGLCSRLFKTGGNSAYVFLLALVAGYPVGAKLVADLTEQGQIEKDEAVRICAFTSLSGPLFIVATIGVGFFLSQSLGLLVLISHIAGALWNGLFFRFYKSKNFIPQKTTAPVIAIPKNILGNSMQNAVQSILTVGGFICIFYLLLDILFLLGLKHNLLGAGISGFLEVTRGCYEISRLNLPQQTTALLITGLVSFGGLSVHMQSFVFLSAAGVRFKTFLLLKLCHAAFAVLVCLFLNQIIGFV